MARATMKGGMSATGLVGAAISAWLSGRRRLLSNERHWQRNSAGIQLAQLRNLLRAGVATRFGKSHGFARLLECSNAELLPAYRKAVPIADWLVYKDHIASMREGAEPDVLWPGLVRDFAQTSGTTAGDKFIPVSRQMLRSNFLASLDIFANLSRFGVSLTKLLSGRSLFLGGSTDLSTSDKGIRTGDLSGIVTPLIRWPMTTIALPGPEIALMNHWPTKIDAMAKRCLDEDVRMISGMPSWALVLFERMQQIARQQGRHAEVLTDLWPNLNVFVHGGVRYAPFEPRVRQMFSGSPDGADIPVRLELYPASEGFIAIQDRQGEPGLRLNSDQFNFFEFVPLESIDDPGAPAFSCDEVEKGQRYVVVLSTCAGLWRYILGDVVDFDTIADRPEWSPRGPGGGDGPPRLRIVGRHRHFINAFGENLIVEHIENAVATAAREAGVIAGEFTAAPVYPGQGRRAGLELAIELAPCEPGAIERLRDAFDAALKAQNVDYTTKRTDGLGMVEPTVSPLPQGAFHAWLASRGKLGGQHKCPRCANHRDIIDAVKVAASAANPTHA
ncbi:MAG: GH3 auxin-responsive promoter family protein [Phycisphaerales bacterium]|nr:GH3 auxin-responsive promoter family protein [Phycisphaerales bacterium]